MHSHCWVLFIAVSVTPSNKQRWTEDMKCWVTVPHPSSGGSRRHRWHLRHSHMPFLFSSFLSLMWNRHWKHALILSIFNCFWKTKCQEEYFFSHHEFPCCKYSLGFHRPYEYSKDMIWAGLFVPWDIMWFIWILKSVSGMQKQMWCGFAFPSTGKDFGHCIGDTVEFNFCPSHRNRLKLTESTNYRKK